MPKGHGPRLKARKDKADYEKRLRTVARMAVRKITEGEIARALDIDQATVSRCLEEIRRRNLEDIEANYQAYQENLLKLLAEMDMHFQEVERELWSEASDSKSASRVAALRGIRELWCDRVDLLLRLGLISTKQSESTETADNYDAFLARFKAREKERGEL